jgi:hypothetical protein
MLAAGPTARESAPEPESEPGAANEGPAEPLPVPLPPLPSSKPLERSERLVGGWDSRSDDGSHSELDFHADGTVIITQAGDPRPRPVKGSWYVVEQKGDDLVVEVGPEFGAAGNFRFTFRFSGADALTLARTVHRSVVQRGAIRYVRVGPPRYDPQGIPTMVTNPSAGRRGPSP